MSGKPDPSTSRLLSSIRLRVTLCGFAVFLGASGCGKGPPAQFGWRDKTQELIPAAEKAVKQVIEDNFGTPQNLVGWERMPVNYGAGVRATVAAAEHGAVTLTLADPKHAEEIQTGQFVQKLTAPAAEPEGKVKAKAKAKEPPATFVSKFDPKALRLTITSAPGQATENLAAGDKLLIGYGSELQLGRVVYMKNCTHCHGVAGDGQGPTARYLNPRPRDFRLGILKFTSTQSPERASRDDIHRTITNGIPGTYMPSFLLMAENEKRAVTEYVRWLSMRGEMEKRLDDELADNFNEANLRASAKSAMDAYNAAVKAGEKPEDKPMSESQLVNSAKGEFTEYEKSDFPGVIDQTADYLAEGWQKADEPESLVLPQIPRVADTAESRLRGRKLFLNKEVKCFTCHGPLGRGDGGSVDDYWPTLEDPNKRYDRRGLHDRWGNLLQPRDLTLGQYRGGRRPLDVYRRIRAGIKGTPMPAFGTNAMTDEQVWDVVNYVMSLPYESKTPQAPKAPAMASRTKEAEAEH